MPEKPFDPEALNEAMALVSAIAQREVNGDIIRRQIKAELEGVDYEPLDQEALRVSYLGQTAMYLAKVSVEDAPISIIEALGAASPQFFAEASSKAGEIIGEEVDADAFRDTAHEAIKEAQANSGNTDEELTERFARTLSSVRAVAAKHGVDAATVYGGELYYEALRQEFSLEEIADRAVRNIDAIDPEVALNAVIRNLDKLLPPALTEGMTEEDMTELVVQLQTNPMVRALMAENLEISKEVSRQHNVYLFDRVFGPNAIASLPLEAQSILTPHQPLVSIVRGED